MTALTPTPQSTAAVSNRPSLASQLVGVWVLVSYTNQQPDHKDTYPFGPCPQGFLIYTSEGFVSAQLMKPGRPAFRSADWHHATPEEYQNSGSGYIAYCGIYEVDEEKGSVTHTPSVSLLPNLIDGHHIRLIDLHGDFLTLRTIGTAVPNGLSVTNRLEWKRAIPDVAVPIQSSRSFSIQESAHASHPTHRLR